MKVISTLVKGFHLDPAYALLTIQNLMAALDVFYLLDIHGTKSLNDVIFSFFLRQCTDLKQSEIDVIFHLLDVDKSGDMEFDEFYMMFCIMVACKDQQEKEFIFRHSRNIFQLIDSDSSGQIDRDEFANIGILFNFDKKSVQTIFNEFDLSGDKNLDFDEFRLFTMACIDEQRISDAHKKVEAYREYNHRLVQSLAPSMKRYIQTRSPPPPIEIEAVVESTRPPYMIKVYYERSAVRKVFRALKTWLVWTFYQLLIFIKKCCCCSKSSSADIRRRGNDEYHPAPDNMNTTSSDRRSCCSRCCRARSKSKREPQNSGSVQKQSHEPTDAMNATQEKGTKSRCCCCCSRKERRVVPGYSTFKAFEEYSQTLQHRNPRPTLPQRTITFKHFDR